MELDFLYKVVNTKTWIEKDIMEALVIYGLYIHSFQITVDITCRFTEFENHKKVSFYIASEASYVYILSGQQFIEKMPKIVNFANFWETKATCKKVLPEMTI